MTPSRRRRAGLSRRTNRAGGSRPAVLLGIRASFTWTTGAVILAVYTDLYLVRVGHEVITLFVLATVQPVVVASEAHLVGLLVGRALSQPH